MSAPAVPQGAATYATTRGAALGRLAGTRRTLVAAIVGRAVLWGTAVAALAWALATLAGGGAAWRVGGLLAGLATAAWLARAAGRVRDVDVALWAERRLPALRYALVTLAEGRAGSAAPMLERAVGAVRWEPEATRAARRALAPAAGTCAAALLAALAAGAWTRSPERAAPLRAAVRAARGAAGTARAADPLARVHVRVVPPVYSGLPSQRLDEPSTIEALEGSAIVASGAGAAGGVHAAVGDASLPTVAADDGWLVRATMPAAPAALSLRAATRSRLVVLAPRRDSIPTAALRLPARDTVLRTPTGSVALRAELRDDIGLRDGGFEVIVSSGEGESFTFRTLALGRAAFDGAREGSVSATLRLDSLALKPGDLLHVRAVARDRNPAAGRAVGASDTRTLRVARLGEYDSVAVDAAPPAATDTSALSQRLLLQLAQALEGKRRSLARADFVAESRRLGSDQARLRRRVGDIVFSRLEGDGGGEHAHGEGGHFAGDGHGHGEDAPVKQLTPEQLLEAASRATGSGAGQATDFAEDESPVVHVNRPLLEAYNHMWDAGRELESAEPGRAIPPMRRAIAALQRARAAERIYLRGRTKPVIVDVAKVRLAGKDSTRADARRPRPALPNAALARAATLDRALAELPRAPQAARDSLALLRVAALGDAPALAGALGAAIDAIDAGRDATEPLARARRLAAGAPRAGAARAAWGAW